MMKLVLPALAALAVSPAASQVKLIEADAGMRGAMAAARNFDQDVTRHLEVLRAPGDRKARMAAADELERLFRGAYFMDQRRISDGLVAASHDHDAAIRRHAMMAAARVAASVSEDYGVTAFEVQRQVRQDLTDRMAPERSKGPHADADLRSDLFAAYAVASHGHADPNGLHDDVFLKEALTDVIERAGLYGDPHKRVAMGAVTEFLRSSDRILRVYHHETYTLVAESLVAAARRSPHAFAPQGAHQPGADPELPFRYNVARCLVMSAGTRFPGSVRIDDHALRSGVKDLLERMYHDETDPTLKRWLGLRLGKTPL